jgi:ABC-type glycerol-3-phosphate transport system substrate-binding protein
MSKKRSEPRSTPSHGQLSRRQALKIMGSTLTATALSGLTGSTPARAAAAPAKPEAVFDFIAEAAKPYRGVQITYMAVNTAQSKDVEPYLGEFEKLTGIKVKGEYGGESETFTKLDLELSSGAGAYDVAHILSQGAARYLRGGWLAPLTPYVENPKLTDKRLWMYDDFYASTIKQLSSGGTLYAVPLFIATQIMYYRKDVFAKNGISSMPETFDDFWKVCEAIDGKPIKALATRGTRGPTMNVWNWTAWLYAFGGEYFKSYDPKSPNYLRPMLDDPRSIQSADFYARAMQKFCPEGAVSWGWQESSRAFKQGQTAIIQEGSPFGAQFMDPKQSQVADEKLIGCFLIPKGPNGRHSPSAAQGWAIPKDSKKKEAAWLFITWATAPARQYRSTIEQPNSMIPRDSVWKREDYRKKYGWGNYIEVVNAALRNAGEWDHYLPEFLPEYTDIGNETSRLLQEVIGGQKKADQAMKEANEAVAAIIKQAGYYKS